MSNLTSIPEQSRSIILRSEEDLIELYDPYKSFLSNSIYEKNKFEDSIYEEFHSLKEKWINDTKLVSDIREKVNHPAHLKLVSWGELIIPKLVLDMVNNNVPWYFALSEITGKNPIKIESRGKFELIVKDWLEWAKENDYV